MSVAEKRSRLVAGYPRRRAELIFLGGWPRPRRPRDRRLVERMGGGIVDAKRPGVGPTFPAAEEKSIVAIARAQWR